jgi:periplasmic divalent cation tolerance protein
MNTMILVFISCENKEQAEKIGSHLVKERLAACVQITPTVSSMFLWPPKEHTVTNVEETLLIVKSLESKWDELDEQVRKHHTYDTPEIIALPVSRVSKKYLEWLTEELI